MHPPPDQIEVAFYLDPVIVQQTIHCDTPINAIARIGGLLFLIRVSSLLRYFHMKLFERDLDRTYRS